MLNIDKTKLRADLKTIATEIRALKAIFRESGQQRLDWRVRADLAAAKDRATRLCCLMAASRGRLHLPKKLDREAQLRLVEPLLPSYARTEATAQAAA